MLSCFVITNLQIISVFVSTQPVNALFASPRIQLRFLWEALDLLAFYNLDVSAKFRCQWFKMNKERLLHLEEFGSSPMRSRRAESDNPLLYSRKTRRAISLRFYSRFDFFQLDYKKSFLAYRSCHHYLFVVSGLFDINYDVLKMFLRLQAEILLGSKRNLYC